MMGTPKMARAFLNHSAGESISLSLFNFFERLFLF